MCRFNGSFRNSSKGGFCLLCSSISADSLSTPLCVRSLTNTEQPINTKQEEVETALRSEEASALRRAQIVQLSARGKRPISPGAPTSRFETSSTTSTRKEASASTVPRGRRVQEGPGRDRFRGYLATRHCCDVLPNFAMPVARTTVSLISRTVDSGTNAVPRRILI